MKGTELVILERNSYPDPEANFQFISVKVSYSARIFVLELHEWSPTFRRFRPSQSIFQVC